MNRLTDEGKVLKVAAQQGWTDATLLDLMGSFIYGKKRRTKRFLKFVKTVQREENGA